MKPRALKILKLLAEVAEEGEEVDVMWEGRRVFVGNQQIRLSTLDELLWCASISEAYSSGPDCRVFVINATGRAIARRPDLAGEVMVALANGKPFSVVDDHVRLL